MQRPPGTLHGHLWLQAAQVRSIPNLVEMNPQLVPAGHAVPASVCSALQAPDWHASPPTHERQSWPSTPHAAALLPEAQTPFVSQQPEQFSGSHTRLLHPASRRTARARAPLRSIRHSTAFIRRSSTLNATREGRVLGWVVTLHRRRRPAILADAIRQDAQRIRVAHSRAPKAGCPMRHAYARA